MVPLLHRILLKMDTIEEVSAGGILIPEVALSKERKAIEIGTVVAVGETAFEAFGADKNTLKIGDRVVVARYSGKEIVEKDEKYVVINDEDVLVKLGEDE